MPIGATIGAIASVAGLGIQAYGQHKAGQAAKDVGLAKARAAESSAQLDDFNASVAEKQAEDAEARGELDASHYRVQTRGVIGQQRTGFAAGNVDVNFGSAVDVQADTAFVSKFDELMIKTNAAREAWGYKVESHNYTERARITRETGEADIKAGEASATAGNIAAIGTIATGSGSLLSQKYGFGKKG